MMRLRQEATAIIVEETGCEQFAADVAWSRILALASGREFTDFMGVQDEIRWRERQASHNSEAFDPKAAGIFNSLAKNIAATRGK